MRPSYRGHGTALVAQPPPTVLCLLSLLLLSMVVCLTSGLKTTEVTHQCIYDKLQASIINQYSALNAATARRATPLGSIGLPMVRTTSPSKSTKVDRDDDDDNFRGSDWQPIRILVSTDDLYDDAYHCTTVGQSISDRTGDVLQCTEEDILTDAKRNTLISEMVPAAIEMHSSRLSVHPVLQNWASVAMTDETCGNFKVPDSHITEGFTDTDFVFYVGSVPVTGSTIAWATTCLIFDNYQPAVGVINIPSANIYPASNTQYVRVVVHEIAHSLGFSSFFFNDQSMLQTVSLRGKTGVPVLNSSMVVEKTREAYGCSTATVMELEDAGGAGTASSHWKMRNAKDELMCGVVGGCYYTNLTLAAFEDLGFYKADYTKSEVLPWGRNAGCDLLDGPCLTNGTSNFPTMFCDDDSGESYCTSERLSIGACVIRQSTTAFPSYAQYFSDPTIGGPVAYMDYCPYVMPQVNTSCATDDDTDDVLFGSFNIRSYASRCISGEFQVTADGGSTTYHAACMAVRCDTDSQLYAIKAAGSSAYVDCPAGFAIGVASLNSTAFVRGGSISCPSFAEVCQANAMALVDDSDSRGNGVPRGVSVTSGCLSAALLLVTLLWW